MRFQCSARCVCIMAETCSSERLSRIADSAQVTTVLLFSFLFLNSFTASVTPEDFSCRCALVLDFGAVNQRRLRRDARYEGTSQSSLHTSSSFVSLSNRDYFVLDQQHVTLAFGRSSWHLSSHLW